MSKTIKSEKGSEAPEVSQQDSVLLTLARGEAMRGDRLSDSQIWSGIATATLIDSAIEYALKLPNSANLVDRLWKEIHKRGTIMVGDSLL